MNPLLCWRLTCQVERKLNQVELIHLLGWFRGATDLLPQVNPRHYNHVPHPKPSKIATAVLRERLKIDLEFFEFAKQRLALQLIKLGGENK